jgi:hypothetical protein
LRKIELIVISLMFALSLGLALFGIFALTQQIDWRVRYQAFLSIVGGGLAATAAFRLFRDTDNSEDQDIFKLNTHSSRMIEQLHTFTKPETQQRLELAKQWIEDLQLVSKRLKMGNEEKYELNAMLDYVNRASFGIPIDDDGIREITFISDQLQHVQLYIVPLLKQDAQMNPYLAENMDLPHYDEITKAIFLPPLDISPLWKGVMFYHDLRRSFADVSKLYGNRRMSAWIEESASHQAEAKILKQLFPDNFDVELDKLAATFEPFVKKGKLEDIDPKAIPPAVLKKMFKQSLSLTETKYQFSFVFLEALHRAVDLAFDSERKRNKWHILVTFWAYDPQGYHKRPKIFGK